MYPPDSNHRPLVCVITKASHFSLLSRQGLLASWVKFARLLLSQAQSIRGNMILSGQEFQALHSVGYGTWGSYPGITPGTPDPSLHCFEAYIPTPIATVYADTNI
jgi:hypothetical protein